MPNWTMVYTYHMPKCERFVYETHSWRTLVLTDYEASEARQYTQVESSQHKQMGQSKTYKVLFRGCALDNLNGTRKILCSKYTFNRWRSLEIIQQPLTIITDMSVSVCLCVSTLCSRWNLTFLFVWNSIS